jgi:hypothetical protein
MRIMAISGEIDVMGFDVKTITMATNKARKALSLEANLLATLVVNRSTEREHERARYKFYSLRHAEPKMHRT